MKLLDLCCGLKGVSSVFEKYGWDTVTVDINPNFNPTITADINNLFIDEHFDFIWASPPCTEYTLQSLPATWKCHHGKPPVLPDMRPFLNCYRIIRYLQPEYWCIENVRGSLPYISQVLGKPRRYKNQRIWGVYPICDPVMKRQDKSRIGGKNRTALRSIVPKELVTAICKGCTP